MTYGNGKHSDHSRKIFFPRCGADAPGAFLCGRMDDPGLQLFEAFRQGDRGAFAELYDRYSAALYGVITKVVHEDVRAEEALQDTFLKIWRSAANYDPAKGRIFTWMLNIARNTALDVVRSAEFRNSANVQTIGMHVYRNAKAEQPGQMDQIGMDRVLEHMSPEHRQVIEMAYYQGWSQQQIADRTGVPLGTVKSRTRTALNQLREALKDQR